MSQNRPKLIFPDIRVLEFLRYLYWFAKKLQFANLTISHKLSIFREPIDIKEIPKLAYRDEKSIWVYLEKFANFEFFTN